MGYEDPATGLWIYDEDDLADDGDGFSGLLNRNATRLPGAVQQLTETAIANDPTIVAAAGEAIDLEIADRDLVEQENDVPDWVWAVMFRDNREVAFGRREDGTYFPDTLNSSPADDAVAQLTDDQGWRFAIRYSDGEVAFGQRNSGEFYPATLGGGGGTDDPVPVSIHGDSLTASWPAAGLSAVLGRPVTGRGNGGQRSYWIAARQGGQPLRVTVTGAAIPAAGAIAVTLAYVPLVGGTTNPSKPAGSYPGVLAGIPGTLTITSDTTGTFTRDTAGRVTPVPPASPFVTGLSVRDTVPIFWAGRNNFKEANDGQQIVNDLRAMLAWTKRPQDAIILSIPPWEGEEIGGPGRVPLDTVNGMIRDAFPAIFEDTAARLRSTDLLSAVGVTPTSQDTADIANGLTPTSFRSDAGHLNATGYAALNLLILDIFTARGL